MYTIYAYISHTPGRTSVKEFTDFTEAVVYFNTLEDFADSAPTTYYTLEAN